MEDKYKNTDYLKRKFLEGEGKLLILSLTKRCNLKCLYCRNGPNWYDKLSENAGKTDFDRSDWPNVLQICKENNIIEILLTGGEPIAYPRIVEFLDYLKKHNIRYSIHTNGIHRSWDTVLQNLIVKNTRPNIALSLELFDELQRDIRGSEIPYYFINHLIKENFNIELKIILHQKLIDYKESIKKKLLIWKEKGIKSVRFQPVMPMNKLCDEKLELEKSFSEVLDILVNIKEHDPILKKFIRNSVESFKAIKSVVLLNKVDKEIVQSCIVKDKILFLSTDNNILNCKSLWQRESIPCSEKTFNYVCCGYKI